MAAVYILTISTIIQFAAAGVALWLIRVTGRWTAWTIVALAISLMAVRRTVTLVSWYRDPNGTMPDLVAESVALVIAILVLTGLALVAPLFRSLRQSLSESNRQFSTVADQLPQLVWTTRPDGWADYFNRRWFDYTGLTFDQSQGWGWKAAVHPDDLQSGLNHWNRALATGNSYLVQYRLRRAGEGTYRWFLARGEPLRNDDGQIVKWFGTCTDFDEQKRLTLALRKSEQRFRRLFEYAADAVYILRLDGRITDVNPQACRQLGYESDEIRAMTIDQIDPDISIETTRDGWSRLGAGQSEHREAIHRRKDGSLFPVEFISVRIDTEAGPMIIGFARNISERKRAEEVLRNAHTTLERLVAERTTELARSNEELKRFASIASHDLQEPLRSVTSYLQMLEDRCAAQLDDDARAYIDVAVKSATRMKQLIRDLLAYSRLDSRTPVREWTDCEATLSIALDNLTAAVQESGAVVTHDELPKVMADPIRLTQLMQNLLDNAIKYRGDRPPVIHVSAEQHDDEWVVSVRDNGIGIDPHFAEKVFVVFQRLHGQNAYSGTGIGLAICKRIVEQMGGRIWIESDKGVGSTFYFTIPAEERNGSDECDDVRETDRDLVGGRQCR